MSFGTQMEWFQLLSFFPTLWATILPLVFFYHIGGAIAFVPPVGLGVDERTLYCEFLLVLLIRKLLPWLRTLIGLVAFFVALWTSHGGPFLKLLHHVFTVILRRLDIALYTFVLQSIQVLHELFHFLLEIIIFLGNEIITRFYNNIIIAFLIARVRARIIN